MAGKSWNVHTVLNVNFPTRKEGVTPEIKVVQQGHYTFKEQKVINSIDPRGKPYYWIGPPPERDGQDAEKDMGVLKSGHVAVTPLSLNLTDYETLKELEGIF